MGSWKYTNNKNYKSGLNWNIQPSNLFELNEVYFFDQNTGWAVGVGGYALKTINSGVNWTVMNMGTNSDLNSLHFVNQNTGWIVGGDGKIFHTTTSGLNWSIQPSNVTIDFNSV